MKLADIGYHADSPQYDGQDSMECDHRPSGKCFYDGSGLNAYDVFQILVSKGEEAVWNYMEIYYQGLKS